MDNYVNISTQEKREAVRTVVSLLCSFDIKMQDIIAEYRRMCEENNQEYN